MTSAEPRIVVEDLAKRFTLHLQGGVTIPVLDWARLTVAAGECVVLTGESGIGKSTLLKIVYGNYRASGGLVRVRHDGVLVDLIQATPRQILAIRKRTLGYVSQFLRCVPRVAAADVVAEPLIVTGVDRDQARARADGLLARLRIPERLRGLPPATFSGGEQQRVNIARGFALDYPIMLLDEPTASLDAANRQTVVELIREAKAGGAAMIGIFHDEDVRSAVADRLVDVQAMKAAA